MTDRPQYIPEHLARLSDDAATSHLTEGLLSGREDVRCIDLDKNTEPLPPQERWRAQPIRDLVEDAMHAFREEPSRPKADAWLAPRLHATLRLTRAEAADHDIWNHVALAVAPDYVVWRHVSRPRHGRPSVNGDRFRGVYHKQAFARLWWAAELFRDGPDYGPVVTACGNQDVLNSVLRTAELVSHRPTALAIVDLLRRGVVTSTREVVAVSAAVNASAATLAYDVLAPDVPREAEAVRAWIDGAESAGAVPRRTLSFDGPPEEKAPEASVRFLSDYFEGLFVDAPVRGRGSEAP
ncbi:DUF6339 family protein [Streptomyces sp. SID5785]|uniref:DUF6339 family protein n=1 Tax=Streptomyces sp. SID5785 TaxID=2690309 RepID=UPI001F3B0F54|nr:DUF6339 family protein [Streptomyces sp. SID5785]